MRTKFGKLIRSCIRLAALLATGLLATGALADSPRDGSATPLPATLATILDDLREGGFVVYLRHTSTVHDDHSNEAEDLARCETQRNLSAKGRAEAVQIGQSIKALGIPIGTVLTSPYCRAKDTAKLAFGRFVENENLGFVVGASASETRQLAKVLRQMLGAPPEKGYNSVIVSHSANLFEAVGIFAKPEGAAYVFRPLADGRFEAVARVLPEEWSDAVRHQAAMPPRSKVAAGK